MFSSKQRVLILSPHTDDAELGCGGTISKLMSLGHEIYWICFSTAEESLPLGFPKDALRTEFQNVLKYLNLDKNNFSILSHKVRKLADVRQEVLESLINIRNSFDPDIVIGPSLNDFHQDHSVVANEMIRAFKTTSSILCYELPWNHVDFKTQFFVNLDKSHINSKIKMMDFYKSQHAAQRHYFSKDFVLGLAHVRGAQINTNYAEAFEVIRWQL